MLFLIRTAIRACKVGGDIIYSTCTLSPVQNEKVVASVINDINSESEDFNVRLVACQSEFYNKRKQNKNTKDVSDGWFWTLDDSDSFGQLILPNILNNYGPGFFCKMRKVAL